MSDFTPDAVKSFNQTVIDEFRANGGKVTGPFAGAPLLLLTPPAPRAAQTRTSPVVHTRDGDRYVIIASKAGAPTNPDWYHNLRGQPPGHHRGRRPRPSRSRPPRRRATSASASGTQQAALMPNFAEYATKTTREIPVVVLTPVA